jgi:hypothetical protein
LSRSLQSLELDECDDPRPERHAPPKRGQIEFLSFKVLKITADKYGIFNRYAKAPNAAREPRLAVGLDTS